MPTSRFVVHSTSALLLVGLVALLAIVGMTFWLGERAQLYFNDVIEARDTRGAAVDLRSAIQTAEASQRGFLLTGNEIYLAPYGPAKAGAQRHLDALRRLLAPYRQSDVMVQRLTEITAQKFEEMDRTIARKRERRDDEVQQIVRSNRGKALTDEANVFFSGVIRAADDRLTAGVGEQRANAAWLRSFSFIGALVIVVVVGGAAITLLRHARELRAARDEVRVLNAGLEERVRERTADLAQVNEEIKRFAYIVTHDLRAPLVNIMGFTGEVEAGAKDLQALVASIPRDAEAEAARKAADADLAEALGFIRSSTKKMDGLIGAILKLSREGWRVLRPEPLDLKDVIKPSMAAIQHQLSEAGGRIDLDVDVPTIVSDRLSLDQILGNLLDNAAKYRATDRPLRIEVRARVEPNDRFSIEIADNGRGIAEQDRERVFELFNRAGAQVQPGEGIGLAHVRTLVRNLGGDITLSSVMGQGTTFRVVLPRQLVVSLERAA